ncbi:Nuclear distribution protein nudE-like 1 [Lamellibrachia satsuma]|nr:Nuclear distribution protein nudE-like 1 [Lamellibrachia satsuma]
MDSEEPTFSSPKEGMEYWKNLAKQYKISLDEVKEELDEFQVSSHELEAELEAQLEQTESKNKELRSANYRLQMDLQSLREKMEQTQQSSHQLITTLQDELAQVSAFKDELQKYIRELEQTNDDLERTKRATVVSLEDFEQRLNQAIERNAFLESELEERETLSITVQRLKDEARDLRSELAVKKPIGDGPSTPHMPVMPNGTLSDHDKEIASSPKRPEGFVTPTTTPARAAALNRNNSGGTPLTASARISALNIVGDLLRKVGALESKLASCRNFVNSQPRNNKTTSPTSPNGSPSWSDIMTFSQFHQQSASPSEAHRAAVSAAPKGEEIAPHRLNGRQFTGGAPSRQARS